MINGKRIAVVMPAYNAEKTLEATVRELPEAVDERILVDDHSSDQTVRIAERLGLKIFVHDRNYGYGRNQQTCYRAFSREVLTSLPLLENSDDFVFDNQMLTQSVYFGFRIGEISCPTKYFEEASSINLRRSVKYGLGVIATTLKFAVQRMGLAHFRIFSSQGRKLDLDYYTRNPPSSRPA